MERNLLVAGFGGQGIMLLGKLLSYAACESTDKNVTFFPSYGAEQRGGTANCYVVISDEMVGSPMGDEMEDLIVMNEPSLNKFIDKLKSGGNLFVNSSIVKTEIMRDDIKIIKIPANDMAIEIGNPKVLNIIMLGAYVAITEVVPIDIMKETILEKLGKKPELMRLNEKAFEMGIKVALDQK